ncbi:acyl-CoA dehydrogenase [Mycolicibacterium sp. BK634]|uniref:acyl-CoA dehydrogenase n=1 Tax=Mycolicibacterium sp. BK634 TaxID=2587099 RepID=UPI001616F9B2
MKTSMLAITEEHRELADAALGALKRAESRRRARSAQDGSGSAESGGILRIASELGWTGLAIAEEYGGSGFGLPELTIVLEALGHEVSPGPFLPTVVASTVIDRIGGIDLRKAVLPGLADGSRVAAVGLGGDVTVAAEGTVAGTSPAVLGAPDADILVLMVGDDAVVVDASADGVEITDLSGLDRTRSVGAVALHDVAVTPDRVLPGAARTARAIWRILSAAEAVGASWACVEMARDYVATREQFGRSIGSFQAVKHHLANMLIAAEQATAATWDAARSDDLDGAWFAAAVASAQATRAQVFTAQTNIQLHGGIGYTWEHDAHLYLRRARTLAALSTDGADPWCDIVAAQRDGVARGATFELPAEADAYRQSARAVVTKLQSLPPEQHRDFLVDSGYLVPHWRAPYGREAGTIEQLVIEEEFADVELPTMGITGWVMLTITEAGTDEQRNRWVEPVLRGQTMWCQLFSEPGAGSDAAAVRTAARRVEGGWRINGQKVWTSLAEQCQWGIATVRTDPDAPKHAGVTMMAIDMSSPGVTVRPLREMTGEALFNEVFFDDVFVPDSDVVGEVGRGWAVARATLGNERVSIAGGDGLPGVDADELIALLDNASADTAAALTRRTGEVIAESHTITLLNRRRASRAILGAAAGPEANVAKLLTAESAQHQTELGMELAGTAAVVGAAPELTHAYIYARCLTIAGGTSEIMRNTIAERLLGLPRDPLMG